jgi:3-dehydroquinate synthase
MNLAEQTVSGSNFSYPVRLNNDLNGLTQSCLELPKVSKFFLVTEREIAGIYQKFLEKEFKTLKIPVHFIYVKGGEKNKHFDKVKKVYEELIKEGADRNSVLIAFGGGVIGDLTGFIAATFLRGIRFVQVPTTLLAMVDSSVGGKVAVNVDKGKNMVGAFYQPSFVFIPLFTLTTISEKEWRCGLAEVTKHAFLAGGNFLEGLSKFNRADFQADSEAVRFSILESIAFKSSIVREDEKETGKRAILNFGHTTGHAIESLTNYDKYSHGEAVAKGMVTALLLSKKILGFSEDHLARALGLIQNMGLSTKIKEKSTEILTHMYSDKKKEGNTLKFVLLRDFGEPEFGIAVEPKLIIETIKEQKAMALL